MIYYKIEGLDRDYLVSFTDDESVDQQKSNTLRKKVAEEKRQREHILQLNQILAKQVMEKSKMVAGEWLFPKIINLISFFFFFIVSHKTFFEIHRVWLDAWSPSLSVINEPLYCIF